MVIRTNERTSMVGGGFYNRNSSLQALVAEECGGLVSPADVQGKSITFADYGCSEGSNSSRMLRKALYSCPQDSTVTIVFNDTPANDYNSLSGTIDRSLREPENKGSRKVFSLMAPQSYYEQVVPNDFVDIGFSTASLHWIARLQPTSPDLLPSDADVSAEVLADITRFLQTRYKEVRKGGHLLLSFPVDGALSLKCAYASIFQTLKDLAADNIIPQTAASKFRLPFHFRTKDEIAQALDAVKDQWQVVEHFDRDVAHPAFLQFQSTFADSPFSSPSAKALDEYSQAISAGFVAIIGNTVVDTARVFRDKVGSGDLSPPEVIRARMVEKLQLRLRESDFWQTPLGNKYVFLKLKKI
ncbi:S-adenosyl-L-methionine-dependent methyltransferase [Aspergillus karnatakaensis]|uniref:S-adenosyl-L-methionine-dependent methyltransferase n=1 Tax=Aspergillus karnatakaensis TaxID=1810916 RepID=UPI003CCC9542